MSLSSSPSWNRSLIEFTKMRRGFLQRSGWSSLSAMSATSRVHRGPLEPMTASPSYGWPGPLNRAATRSA